MKSRKSNTSNLNWGSDIEHLFTTKKAKSISKLQAVNINRLYDLIWIFPLRVNQVSKSFEQLEEGQYYSGRGVILHSHKVPNFRAKGRNRVPLCNISATIQIESRTMELRWFNAYPNVFKNLSKGSEVSFLGQVKYFNNTPQIISPKINLKESSDSFTEYPTINTIPGKDILKLIQKIPENLWGNIPSIIPTQIRQVEMISLTQAMQKIHGIEQLDISKEEAEERIVYEELMTEQISLQQRKHRRMQENLLPNKFSSTEVKKTLNLFPFQFTKDQQKGLKDIIDDLGSTVPMMRLIQGDVGCGKTAIAFAAGILMNTNGFQVALMCPTESLARQHFKNLQKIFPHGKNALLLGSTKLKEKKEIYEQLEKGDLLFVIGTHSLVQEKIQFKNLGLTIIDEQHKFGVQQRLSLTKKASLPHTLIMSATPIPRSLSLTQYGDLSMSIIKEKPNGRSEIPTRIVGPEKYMNFLNFLNTRLSMGEQAYVVVPAIEESEFINIQDLESILKKFKEIFHEYKVEGLHGKMKPIEKEEIFQQFGENKIQILVATSLIEVGIDVENATIMSVFSPERFGLSSLHQLRGRVGRGSKPGFFFLINDKKISNESLHRLKVIEDSCDGFKIAEEDLAIRGEGDILGENQSGLKHRRLADITKHQDILLQTSDDLTKMKDNFPTEFNHILSMPMDDLVQYTI